MARMFGMRDLEAQPVEARLKEERKKNSPSLTDSKGCGVITYVGRGPVDPATPHNVQDDR
jgi:hypothetical protein